MSLPPQDGHFQKDHLQDDRLRAMLDDYGHVLRRAIRRIMPRAHGTEVDDIEQEARVRLWRALGRDIRIEKPASYLYRLAVHAALDAIQRRDRRREMSLDEAAVAERAEVRPSPERTAVQRAEVERVRRAMERLMPNRRRAVGLHLNGFTSQEIADFFDWTEPKARNLVYRGLGDLRRHLHDSEFQSRAAG